MNKKQGMGSPGKEDLVFPIWKAEGQIKEQLHRGVKTINGSVVAVAISSSAFTYVRKIGNELVVKYVEGCVVTTASAKLAGEEVKLYDVSVHNICSRVDL